MKETIKCFIQTIENTLNSMEYARLMNYQRPLVNHAFETMRAFEKECVSDLSKCLKSFFGTAEVGLEELFKKEIKVVKESVDTLLSYKPSSKWYDKAISLILTVIGSIKNPLVKAGLEILEEAMKFIKK